MKRTWIGIIIILIGIGFLLEQMNIMPFVDVLAKGWPVILILIGLTQLLQKSRATLITGLLFIIVGVIFLLNGWTNYNFLTYLWPLFIIYVGLIFVFYRAKANQHIDEENMLESVAIFSGSEIKSRSNPLQGGSITAVFGGSEIDLTEAVVTDKQITIEVISIFGGVSLHVPDNAHIHITGIPIFGGWEDNTRHYKHEDDDRPIIHLKCVTIFGGLEVKN